MREDSFPKTVRGFYWQVIKKFPVYYGILFAIGLCLFTINMVFTPLTLKWITELFENALSYDLHKVTTLAILLLCMWVVNPALWMVRSFLGQHRYLFSRYQSYILYKRIYANDTSFFINHPSGQIISWAGEVCSNIDFLMERFWTDIIGTCIGFIFIMGALFTMNIWFVVMLGAFGAIKIIWQWQIQKKVKANTELQVEEQSKYSGLRSDSLNNALAVKFFANSEYENMYIYKGEDKLINILRHGNYLNRLQNSPMSLIWVSIRVLCLLLCFALVRNGEMSMSNAVFVITSIGSINLAFSRVTDILREYSTKFARATKAYNNLIAPIQIMDKAHAKNLKIKRATIDFDNVSFGYGRNNVFTDFNLHIDNAKKVGVVGLSGAGKTTLCNLLLRMYDVQKGSIKIDGVDIRDVKKDSLLRNISFVPQEITLFNRTIFENIQYARPNATRAQVINAAKKAHIHEFISKLPDGYNTLVGNNGIKLSGGQRQRLSIARALLKNAPILVLDEATSALDSKNEVMIQKSLANAMRGKTTVVIAHRLSTLRNMDWSIVIKNGKIIEMGSHQQLLRQGGEYKKLWDLQTSGFIS